MREVKARTGGEFGFVIGFLHSALTHTVEHLEHRFTHTHTLSVVCCCRQIIVDMVPSVTSLICAGSPSVFCLQARSERGERRRQLIVCSGAFVRLHERGDRMRKLGVVQFLREIQEHVFQSLFELTWKHSERTACVTQEELVLVTHSFYFFYRSWFPPTRMLQVRSETSPNARTRSQRCCLL